MEYRKLVRDKVPEIIEKDGKKAIYTNQALKSNKDFEYALQNKLVEEVLGLLRASSYEKKVEEMADIHEVLLALDDLLGPEIIEEKRKDKREKKGAFFERYYLISVEDYGNED